MHKKTNLILLVLLIIVLGLMAVFLFRGNKIFETNQYNYQTSCTSNYNSNSRTVRFAVTNDKGDLVLDEKGNKIIKTTQEVQSDLSIGCKCNITYNNKQFQYDFEIHNSYDYELTEEQKDCTPICNKLCEKKLEELKSEK